jgi:hypothetical protein
LVGPPLSTADKVSSGLECVLSATGDQPVPGLHRTLISPGGGGQLLQAGTIPTRLLIGAQDLALPVILLAISGQWQTDRRPWQPDLRRGSISDSQLGGVGDFDALERFRQFRPSA